MDTISCEQKLLAEALERDAWSIIDRQTTFATSIYAEIWKIESVTRPVGLVAFVTFLNNPLPTNAPRKPYAVHCTNTSPAERNDYQETIAWVAMTDWEQAVVDVVENLARFRNTSI